MNKTRVDKKTVQKKRPFYQRKWFWWPVGTLLGIVLAVWLAFQLSPWPGALIIRWDFDQNSVKVIEALKKHEPTNGVVSILNQQYRTDDKDAKLDVYLPEGVMKSDQKLPVLIWTHGGAWLSGDKADWASYFKLIAREGYAVIAPNYTLAPEKSYPTAIHQLNDMYAYVQENATRFHANTGQIFLAGDSAGSQLSAQMAALVTNPAYASEVDIEPNLKPEQLKGVILNCGIYMMERLAEPSKDLSKLLRWGDDVTVWAYSGTHNFTDPVIRQMSPYYHVTKDFPPVYITGGNADPLTDTQSKPLADKLQVLGVEVTRLFYPANHQPALPHEYQFNLDNQDGQKALEAMLAFMKARVK